MEYYEAKENSDYFYISSLFRADNTQHLNIKTILPQEVKKDHSEKRKYFIVKNAGQNIGYFNIYFSNNNENARFGMIIDKPFQGKGFGVLALKTIERIAKDGGAKKLTAEVFPGNEPAKKIYSNAGFKEVCTIVYLEKEL